MEATIKFSKYVFFHFISLIFVLWTVIMKFSSQQWKHLYYLIIQNKKTEILWKDSFQIHTNHLSTELTPSLKWLCYILGWFEKQALLIALLLYTHTKRRHIPAHLQTSKNNRAKNRCLGGSNWRNGQISKQDHLSMNVDQCSIIHLKI